MRKRGGSIPQLKKPQFHISEAPSLKRFTFIYIIIFVCLIGCGKKSIRKQEIRAITSEIVAAAQKTTQRKSEIAIRPEVQPADADATHPSADDVYVTLSDASQANGLRRALDQIVRRHKLSISETTSDSVVRLDFLFKGTRTHTVHVVTPVVAQADAPVSRSGPKSRPKLAIILDDMGYDRAAADAAFKLQFPITLSVIPHLPLSAEVAEEAYRRGDQVLLHLPMEAEANQTKAEPVELRVGMKADQVERDLDGMLETVPHAMGVNNHQGSRATADATLMAELMPALRRRNLFFIDSRTTAATVAYDAAERAGVRSASRKVFLDDMPKRDAILAQLDLAARDAERDGFAIAIGHPHPATIAALVEAAPRLEARGVRLVFVSDVVR
jgi:polysaccharide deacetylase 2 family uncharacterized protein YibQ